MSSPCAAALRAASGLPATAGEGPPALPLSAPSGALFQCIVVRRRRLLAATRPTPGEERYLRFVHLENWPGFKSGALNHGLEIADPRAEIIAVVDAA